VSALCFVGVPPLVHCPGPLSHSLLFTSPEVLVLLPPLLLASLPTIAPAPAA
jgi:hypothetical protein